MISNVTTPVHMIKQYTMPKHPNVACCAWILDPKTISGKPKASLALDFFLPMEVGGFYVHEGLVVPVRHYVGASGGFKTLRNLPKILVH